MRRYMFAGFLAIASAILGCGASQKSATSPSASPEGESADTSERDWYEEAWVEDEQDSSESGSPSTEEESSEEGALQPSHRAEGSSDAPQTIREPDEPGAGECRDSAAPLALSVDRKFVDLKKGSLQAKMDGRICSVSLTFERKGGLPRVAKRFRYAGPERELRWTPIPRDDIARIEIRVTSDNGAYESVYLVPWSVTIDHEEVVFDTDQATIRESEVQSLKDSLMRIKEVLAEGEEMGLGTISLFIAGHTDTQGSEQHNRTLSRNRARAIAAWFMEAGLCVPIAFQGFGETALKRVTADEVDEEENRRADYILSVEPPVIREGAPAAWQWISEGC
jgi:outer membrane protein OmpA-like peptidoglycan-associated protein